MFSFALRKECLLMIRKNLKINIIIFKVNFQATQTEENSFKRPKKIFTYIYICLKRLYFYFMSIINLLP